MSAEQLKSGEEARLGGALSLLVARAQIQHGTWDSLDSKIAGSVALSAAIFAILVSSLGQAETISAAGWFGVGFTTALMLLAWGVGTWAYVPREIASLVPPQQVVATMNDDRAIHAWCTAIAESIEENRVKLGRKQALSLWTMGLAASEVVSALFVAALLLA